MRQTPLLLALLLPVACAAPPEQPADTAQLLQDVLANHQASLAGIGGGQVPGIGGGAVPGIGAAGAPRAAAPVARIVAAPSGQPPGTAGQLVGQTPDAVLSWLGEPRLRRQEGPAEVWHYQATDCHLDIVLYREEGPRPELRVAFASARAVGTARRGEAACLRDIARGAARPGAPGLTEQAEAGG